MEPSYYANSIYGYLLPMDSLVDEDYRKAPEYNLILSGNLLIGEIDDISHYLQAYVGVEMLDEFLAPLNEIMNGCFD